MGGGATGGRGGGGGAGGVRGREGGGEGVRGKEGIEAESGEEFFHCTGQMFALQRGHWRCVLGVEAGDGLYRIVWWYAVFVPSSRLVPTLSLPMILSGWCRLSRKYSPFP